MYLLSLIVLIILFPFLSFHSFLLEQINRIRFQSQIDKIEKHQGEAEHSQIFSDQCGIKPQENQCEREFAKDNKQLGTFRLDGIAPARRGVPQIEVTFDIDVNGIVHVSAKDLGTGKEQNITITSSTNMSKDDIDKAVKEAEAYAEEDKKRKDEVDTKNNAENMVMQCESTLEELGDKVPASEKADVESKCNDLKEALKGTDTALIKQKSEDLQKALYDLSSKLYQQAGGAQGNPDMGGAATGEADNGSTNNGGDDDVIDADYKEV